MPYSLVVEWAFSRDRDFQRGTGSVLSSSLYFGIIHGYRYVNCNTRSHFFAVSELVVMSVADFIRNFHSPVLIKMIGKYRIGRGI